MVQDPQLPRHASDPLATVRCELRRLREWAFAPRRPRLVAVGALAVIIAGTLTGDAVARGWHAKPHQPRPAAAAQPVLGPALGAPAPQPAAGRPVVGVPVQIGWSGIGAQRPAWHSRFLPPPPQTEAAPAITALAANGIPLVALEAYKSAAARVDAVDPSCGLNWSLLAGIGRVESDHGQYAGAQLHSDGTTTPHIIGIALTGHGTAFIPAPSNGLALDGDAVYAHALGPMQFIPSTWAAYRSDGNGDGVADVFNIFDATLGAARYLCASGANLATLAGQRHAVFAYNHSGQYVAEVLALAAAYASGISVVGIPGVPATGTVPPVHRRHRLPPVNPGPPTALGKNGKPATHPSSAPASSSPSASPSATGSMPATGSSSPTGSTSPTGSGSTTGSSSPTGSTSPTSTPTTPDCPSTSPASSTSPTGSSSPTDPTSTPTAPDCPSTSPTTTPSDTASTAFSGSPDQPGSSASSASSARGDSSPTTGSSTGSDASSTGAGTSG